MDRAPSAQGERGRSLVVPAGQVGGDKQPFVVGAVHRHGDLRDEAARVVAVHVLEFIEQAVVGGLAPGVHRRQMFRQGAFRQREAQHAGGPERVAVCQQARVQGIGRRIYGGDIAAPQLEARAHVEATTFEAGRCGGVAQGIAPEIADSHGAFFDGGEGDAWRRQPSGWRGQVAAQQG